MGQFLYDKLNSFGQLDITGLGTGTPFPDVLNLDGADVSRMTVDIKIAGAAPAVSGAPTAAGVTVSVQGSNDPAFSASEVIGQRLILLDVLSAGEGSVAVSPSRYKYVRVVAAKYFSGGTTPAFSAGLIEAFVNSYQGKSAMGLFNDKPPAGNTAPPAGNDKPPEGNTAPPAGNGRPPEVYSWRCVEACTFRKRYWKPGDIIELSEKLETLPRFEKVI
jgi:hypothetical protein